MSHQVQILERKLNGMFVFEMDQSESDIFSYLSE